MLFDCLIDVAKRGSDMRDWLQLQDEAAPHCDSLSMIAPIAHSHVLHQFRQSVAQASIFLPSYLLDAIPAPVVTQKG